MAKIPEFPIHGSPYFDVREFVHPKVFAIFGKQSQMFVDPKAVRIADVVRETFGACTINDYMFGGKRVASGFRAIWEKTGGEYSQHRAGRAIDIRTRLVTEKEMFAKIMQNWKPFYEAGLTRIENVEVTIGWLHLDCAPVIIEPGKFLIVDPKI